METVTFATSNDSKAREVESILAEFNLKTKSVKLSLHEIQSDSIEEIAKVKSKHAFSLLRTPVLVEDDGLFISSLRGFPGQYSSFVFKTIGNDGILRLLNNSDDRSAVFRAIIAYCDSDKVHVYHGEVKGQIAHSATGGGWGFDPIFRPDNSKLTFGEMGNLKHNSSHRRSALEKFAEWYVRYDSP